MFYSKTAKQNGASGFFFDGDKNAPADAIPVSNADISTAINLPPGATFDFDTDGVLRVTPAPIPSAAEVKAAAATLKWQAIKDERDRRQLDGGVEVDGHWFLSTDRATSEYSTVVNTSAGIPADTVVRAAWRTMDGATVDMTPAMALRILTAGLAQRCAIDDAAQAHRAAMEASDDPASYDFSGGWPKIYGE